jgi:hypothetical protein
VCCVFYVYPMFLSSHCLCFIDCCLHLFTHGKLFLVCFYFSVMVVIPTCSFGFWDCKAFVSFVICIHFYSPICFYIQCISNVSNFLFVMSTLSVSNIYIYIYIYIFIYLFIFFL